jgi:hypothetical protein
MINHEMTKTRKKVKKVFVFSPPQADVYAINPPQADKKIQ